MITHLTLTGSLAGTPICGEPRNNTDNYVHAVYYERIKETVCSECVKVLIEVENEVN